MAKFRPRDIVRKEGTQTNYQVSHIDCERGALHLNTGEAIKAYRCTLVKPYDPVFEIGEEVECIDATDSTTLNKGEIYTIADKEERFSFCNRLQRVVLEETGAKYMAARFTRFDCDKKFKDLQRKLKESQQQVKDLTKRLEEIERVASA